MRVSEVVAPTKRPSLSDAGEILQHAGYRRIGVGSYGFVYRRASEPFVLKLFRKEDEAYHAFVEYAMAHPNRHLPKFRGRPVKVTDEYSAIRMEHLEPSDDDLVAQDIGAYVFCQQNGSSVPALDQIKIDRLKATQPSLFALVQDMTQQLVLNGRFHCDMHHSNLMRRGDTIVLTDPICGRRRRA